MKKINKYFILSFVVTTIICVVVLFFISERINKSLEYSISSSFTLQTNNEALTSQVYDVSDITVRNNDLIFDFIVSNLNDRDVKYEIMVLLNNQLKENAFENEQAVKNMEIQKSNSQMCEIKLKKDDLEYKTNELLIIIRQDCDIHSSDNELLADSNTVIRRIVIKNDEMKKENPEIEENGYIKNIILSNKDDETTIKPLNCKDELVIKVSTSQDFTFEMSPSFKSGARYKIICIENSEIAKINGENYFMYDSNTKQKLKIKTPGKPGKFEVEFIAIPYYYIEDMSMVELNIFSSNRYTFEVKQ